MDKLPLTFLQKGHTENENDSVHSVIERATKNAVIYSPEQWYSAVRTARKSKTPYHVEELTHAQLIDYKTMSKSVKNLNMDDKGNKVKWSSVRQFLFMAPIARHFIWHTSTAVQRNEWISAEGKGVLAIHLLQLRKRRLHFVSRPWIEISRVKKDDLISLCHAGLVPVTYHSFYEGLPLCSGEAEGSDEDYTMISKTLKKFKKTFFMRLFSYRCHLNFYCRALNRNKIDQLGWQLPL